MSLLPVADSEYLSQKEVSFEEIKEGGQNAIILKNIVLPENKYDQETTDVLVLLPNGYNDIGPDMFYTSPRIKLKDRNSYAKAADVPHAFNGITWQRWSRHAQNSDWRPGIDGIRTLVQRIKHALEVATT